MNIWKIRSKPRKHPPTMLWVLASTRGRSTTGRVYATWLTDSTIDINIHRRLIKQVGLLLWYVDVAAVLEEAAPPRELIHVNGVDLVKRASTKFYKLMPLISTRTDIFRKWIWTKKQRLWLSLMIINVNYSSYVQYTGRHQTTGCVF